MKKTHDYTIVIAVGILILFALFTIIYVFGENNIKDNTTNNNITSNIYSEHTHQIAETENTSNIKKTYEDLATYTTKIYDTDKNRIYNIKLASEILDGHIVAAHEEFSFNNTMGEMGAADGYKKAIGFDSKGNKIKMYGGGICQISSTLYNAVLVADLEVTERHAHSRRVYYVPKDKDATVFYGGPDFKFVNTSKANIMICVSTDGHIVTVTLKQEKIIET